MEAYKCAFSNTLITKQFGCEKGEQVTRRGGPDVACTSEEAHLRCEKLFQQMKAAALPAFGVEDDLLSMPHSVLVKIQIGGLLGLQRLLESGAAGAAEVKTCPCPRQSGSWKIWQSRRYSLPGAGGGHDFLQAQTPGLRTSLLEPISKTKKTRQPQINADEDEEEINADDLQGFFFICVHLKNKSALICGLR